MKTLKILAMHGLGDHRNVLWEDKWRSSLEASIPLQNKLKIEYEFINYDHIFEQVDISAWESAKAFWKLTRSGAGSIFRQRGTVGKISEKIKWTAGYVVAWVEDEGFQQQTRELLLQTLRDYQPDILLAHSLGSLISYNTLSHPHAQKQAMATTLKKMHYVSLGSQIGNPFVIRNLTPGRIEKLPIKRWYHLYNEEDAVFTSPISLPDMDGFQQVDTHFDIDGIADHAAEQYLSHPNTQEEVWLPVCEQKLNAKSFGPSAVSRKKKNKLQHTDRPDHRALLIGINDYPNPQDRLNGCVNDAFLMSSVLQECGFAADQIRLCLNDRATARGILERIEWLFDDPREGDQRVFYFSGHGASIPEYGFDNEPDRLMETLVPYDFDWSPETAISDEQIFNLYSQLPYEVRTAMIFDCCHSGGIHRDGFTRAKALTAPDDVRHRSLKWDQQTEMWVPREFKRLNKDFSKNADINAKFFGHNGHTSKLGRASLLRGLSEKQYNALRKKSKDPVGPYLPLIIESCREAELSYEYQHGVSSYGAFTYSIAKLLRKYKRITFDRLVEETAEQLAELGYDQTPQILGPGKIVYSNVPWL